jgi:hypothetical protein
LGLNVDTSTPPIEKRETQHLANTKRWFPRCGTAPQSAFGKVRSRDTEDSILSGSPYDVKGAMIPSFYNSDYFVDVLIIGAVDV